MIVVSHLCPRERFSTQTHTFLATKETHKRAHTHTHNFAHLHTTQQCLSVVSEYTAAEGEGENKTGRNPAKLREEKKAK